MRARWTIFYRHPIPVFSFNTLDGKEKGTAYKFPKNVCDVRMSAHSKECTPVYRTSTLHTFLNLQESELQFPSLSGLSQDPESHHYSESNTDSTSLAVWDENESRNLGLQRGTPDNSFTQQDSQCDQAYTKQTTGVNPQNTGTVSRSDWNGQIVLPFLSACVNRLRRVFAVRAND